MFIQYKEVIALGKSFGFSRRAVNDMIAMKIIIPDPVMATLHTSRGRSVRKKYRRDEVEGVFGKTTSGNEVHR